MLQVVPRSSGTYIWWVWWHRLVDARWHRLVDAIRQHAFPTRSCSTCSILSYGATPQAASVNSPLLQKMLTFRLTMTTREQLQLGCKVALLQPLQAMMSLRRGCNSEYGSPPVQWHHQLMTWWSWSTLLMLIQNWGYICKLHHLWETSVCLDWHVSSW